MIKRNQSSMTLLNNVMTNTIHFSDSEFIQFQLRGDASGTDVNFIIVRMLILLLYLYIVQLDLHAVYSTVH